MVSCIVRSDRQTDGLSDSDRLCLGELRPVGGSRCPGKPRSHGDEAGGGLRQAGDGHPAIPPPACPSPARCPCRRGQRARGCLCPAPQGAGMLQGGLGIPGGRRSICLIPCPSAPRWSIPLHLSTWGTPAGPYCANPCSSLRPGQREGAALDTHRGLTAPPPAQQPPPSHALSTPETSRCLGTPEAKPESRALADTATNPDSSPLGEHRETSGTGGFVLLSD